MAHYARTIAIFLGESAGFCFGGVAWIFVSIIVPVAVDSLYPPEDDFVNPNWSLFVFIFVIGILPAVFIGAYIGDRIARRLFRMKMAAPPSTH